MLVRPSHQHVTCAALSRDGAHFAAGFADGAMVAGPLEPCSRMRRIEGLAQSVELLSFSLDGRSLLGGATSGTVLVWDTLTGRILRRLFHPATLTGAAILGPRQFMTAAESGEVWIWDDVSNEEPAPRKLSTPLQYFDRCLPLDGGGLVLTQGFEWVTIDIAQGTSELIKPQEFDDRELVRYVGRVSPAEGGNFVIIYWDDAKVYETRSGRCLHQFPRALAPGDVCLSASGQTVAIGSAYGKLLVLEVDGRILFDREVTSDEIVQVCLSAQGDRVLFVDLNGGFAVFDVPTNRCLLSHADVL